MTSAIIDGGVSKLSNVPLLIPSKLRSLLLPVKRINERCTLNEVLDGMKEYICKKHLYDNRNPHLVHCENDALKEVLGVDHFTLYEIRRLLFKTIIVDAPKNIQQLQVTNSSEESSKRKAESGGEEPKRVCGESSSSPSFDTSTHISTILVSDSSDDGDDELPALLAGEFFAVNHTFDIEYEVDSDSSGSFKSLTDSDSEFEDVMKISAVEKIIKVESDIEFWADMSSDDFCDNSDVEIPESDKWVCHTCGSRNKPLMRYCLKCWAERNGWSDCRKERRPKNKQRKKKESDLSSESKMQIDTDCFSDLPSSQESIDSGLSQSTCSSQPSSIESCVSSSSSASSSSSSSSLCILCCEKPKNATVVHGNSGHQFSCYRCARKLLSLKKPCPICRKNIDRVIHQIFIS